MNIYNLNFKQLLSDKKIHVGKLIKLTCPFSFWKDGEHPIKFQNLVDEQGRVVNTYYIGNNGIIHGKKNDIVLFLGSCLKKAEQADTCEPSYVQIPFLKFLFCQKQGPIQGLVGTSRLKNLCESCTVIS